MTASEPCPDCGENHPADEECPADALDFEHCYNCDDILPVDDMRLCAGELHCDTCMTDLNLTPDNPGDGGDFDR